MVLLRSIAVVLMLFFASAGALAQSGSQGPIEQQMSPEEFKAAGLGKLSAEELARLNAWLNRTIDTESTKAAARAEEKVKSETRGFFNFGSSEPIVSSIVGEFRGFEKHRSYTLANGQAWKQIDGATLVGVRKTDPKVRITPSLVGNSWYLAIDGYNTRAQVIRTK